eukprot:5381868-Prorocentrum_lima.AAC.1
MALDPSSLPRLGPSPLDHHGFTHPHLPPCRACHHPRQPHPDQTFGQRHWDGVTHLATCLGHHL